jgi:hypothetical protein
MYVKFMLAVLVVATAMLAFRVSRPVVIEAPMPATPGSAEAALDREMDPVPLWDMTVEAAVRKLQIMENVKIDVDWDALAKAGIHPDDHIVRRTYFGNTKSSPFSETIEAALTARHPGVRLVCEGVGDTIFVTTETAFAKGLTVRTYDVRDLLTDKYWGIAVAPADVPDMQEHRLESLIRVIEGTIGWRTWEDRVTAAVSQIPGNGASIDAWAGRLIVTQSPRNHRKIERLLATLRQMQ